MSTLTDRSDVITTDINDRTRRRVIVPIVPDTWAGQIGRTLLLVLTGGLLLPAAALAATITVTTTGDTTANDGLCSLREAITSANSNTVSGAAAGECPAGSLTDTDTIVLTNATYSLTSSVPDSAWGATGLPTVTSAITIQGNGAAIRRASGTFRIARVNTGGTLTLDHVTIRGGLAETTTFGVGRGAGLFNIGGTLILTNNSVVRNNTIQQNVSGGRPLGFGAGIYNTSGTLSVISSTLSDNLIDLTSTGVTDTAYDAPGAFGGGLYNSGTATITDSVVANNRVRTAQPGETDRAYGGGLYSDGGLFTLTVTDSTIINNEASTTSGYSFGGGLYGRGTMTIDGSSISGNSSVGTAAVQSPAGGGASASCPYSSYTWPFTISNSTISDNEATGSGLGVGGGLDLTGCSLATLANVTIANNRAGASGGGLHHTAFTPPAVTNTIIAGNLAGGSTINATADCEQTLAFSGNGHNLVGSGTGCMADQTTDRTVSPSIVSTNVLGSLSNSGGSTYTHALRKAAGNPAVDAGDPATCAAAPVSNVDQLGLTRPFNGDGTGTASCDIGAVELQSVVPAIGLTTSASAAPASLAPDGTTTITASVTSTRSQALLVDVEVYDADGNQVYQQFYDNEQFTAGVQRSFISDWSVPGTTAPGAFTVKVGVFSPGWTSLLNWNDAAITITVN